MAVLDKLSWGRFVGPRRKVPALAIDIFDVVGVLGVCRFRLGLGWARPPKPPPKHQNGVTWLQEFEAKSNRAPPGQGEAR